MLMVYGVRHMDMQIIPMMHGGESLEHNLFWKFQSERKAGETKHCFKKGREILFSF